MKAIFVSLFLVLFSLNAGASSLQVEVIPQNPVVIEADLVTGDGSEKEYIVHGPFFASQFSIVNQYENAIVVTGLEYQVVSSQDEHMSYLVELDEPALIPAGEDYQTPLMFVGSLPADDSFQYNVQVDFIGSTGANDSSSGAVIGTVKFVTQ